MTNKDTDLHFRFTPSWGRERYYPLNPPARNLCKLVRAKTLTLDQINIAKRLTLKIKITADQDAKEEKTEEEETEVQENASLQDASERQIIQPDEIK